ncbi:DUF4954 family protein [candidate division KSB1 bacterium]|nr:DUF4954 family protein [candidate division KSB1 bacterium]
MAHVHILPADRIGKDFIPAEFLPKGKDEYYLRNTQFDKSGIAWRHLRSSEVEHLVKNGNVAESWDDILVTDVFDPDLILNSKFFGLIRISALKHAVLEHHDLKVSTGITNSKIIACDIGDDVAIHNVRYLSHYIIGDRCILTNIDEMHTTDYAKFGNGVIKQGESEKVRVWLDLMNETGSRAVMSFDGMLPADAYLWSKYRDDDKLQKALKKFTQERFDDRRGFYGTVDSEAVIKNSRILKDVKVGPCCYIKGANKLKNLTIHSSDEERTQIGEGVELVNGIIGYGCHIFYGVKAVRFILGNNSSLKYGARLIHSFLGASSTISCCEVLNNLIFPAHEQHHNNSFLIASVLKGQSNLAAGATIGSNHNSRANDNELEAGRGFWPGLCSSVKHSCRFASFVLLSKADYPAEMNIPLPFSLLNNNVSRDELEIMPSFWWLYNMYALARNSWKFQARDDRKTKLQNIEFEALAPDTVEEIFHARHLIENWTAKALLKSEGKSIDELLETDLIRIGRNALEGLKDAVSGLEVLGERIEKTRRKVRLLKVWEGYHAYGEMLHYYAVKNLMDYLESNSGTSLESMCQVLSGKRQAEWVNLGGQLMPVEELDKLRKDIGSGKLNSWDAIHNRYQALWKTYPLQKQRHAFATLCAILGDQKLEKDQWHNALDRAVKIQELIRDRVYSSRNKDYENPYRLATYRNEQEMTAAIGTIEDNSFIKQISDETKVFREKANTIKNKD